MANAIPGRASHPLDVEEVIRYIRNRWGVTYELRLLIKGKSLYLHLMWGYLEQQSFPMKEESFRAHLNRILEIINRGGQSALVRNWLENVQAKPRLGKAITLSLPMDQRMDEFFL